MSSTRGSSKRARFESASDTGEVVMEVRLEQASQEMNEDILLVSTHQKRESAFYAYKSLDDKARGLIDLIGDAKRESEVILQEAKKEAEAIRAVAVQDAEKEAESVLAGALAEKTALVQDAENAARMCRKKAFFGKKK
jgi:hypothetical protein